MERFLKLGEGAPVVIDVLRASSTIVTALANGIKEVVPVTSKKEALKLQRQDFLIAGEQDGVKLDGFDLGNSPTELLNLLEKQCPQKLAIKTTNATDLLCSLPEAFVVSILNLETAKKKLHGKKLSLIAVGSRHGLVEDLIVAVALHMGLNGLDMNSQWISKAFLFSEAAKHLGKIGYSEDVEFIVNTSYDVLPKLENGTIHDSTCGY